MLKRFRKWREEREAALAYKTLARYRIRLYYSATDGKRHLQADLPLTSLISYGKLGAHELIEFQELVNTMQFHLTAEPYNET